MQRGTCLNQFRPQLSQSQPSPIAVHLRGTSRIRRHDRRNEGHRRDIQLARRVCLYSNDGCSGEDESIRLHAVSMLARARASGLGQPVGSRLNPAPEPHPSIIEPITADIRHSRKRKIQHRHRRHQDRGASVVHFCWICVHQH